MFNAHAHKKSRKGSEIILLFQIFVLFSLKSRLFAMFMWQKYEK